MNIVSLIDFNFPCQTWVNKDLIYLNDIHVTCLHDCNIRENIPCIQIDNEGFINVHCFHPLFLYTAVCNLTIGTILHPKQMYPFLLRSFCLKISEIMIYTYQHCITFYLYDMKTLVSALPLIKKETDSARSCLIQKTNFHSSSTHEK